jgi:predicted O-linked N-acetylglucosamine transferase (SPINDLY family)
MGVPVVTLAGDRSVARCGVRNLKYVGLAECVAENESEYIEKALALAHDLPRLNGIRQGLRERIANQPASDPETYTREVEGAYRKMWETWCETQSVGGTV